MAMDKKLKKAWIAALRSGKYKQATGTLEATTESGRIKGNCCLGVLCRISGKKPKIEGRTRSFDGDHSWLSSALLEEFGLTDAQMHRLGEINDAENKDGSVKNTFKDIANYIDSFIKVKAA